MRANFPQANWVGICMVLGAGVGVTFGNVALGAGLGLVLGAALKAYFGTASSKNSKTQDGNDG